MPAQRLSQQTVSLRRFDVVGQDSAGEPHFVRHVGLSSEQRGQLRALDTVSLTHMGPPLEHGSAPGPVHVVGSIPLTADEIQQINVFVDERLLEYQASQARSSQQYLIRPHVRAHAEADGTVVFHRYNCAGFVIEAHREAGIDLLVTTEDRLPPVSLEALAKAFPDQAARLQNPRFRSNFDLPGEGPWPVVLAGYVLNALARAESEIRSTPYLPTSGDEYFPRRR